MSPALSSAASAAMAAVVSDRDLFSYCLTSIPLNELGSVAKVCHAFADAVQFIRTEWSILRLTSSDLIYQQAVTRALCVLPGHNIVLGDTYNHRVQIHNPELRAGRGGFSLEPRLWKSVYYPEGLAFDGDSDHIYISTASSTFEGVGNRHRVMKLRLADGIEIAHFPGAIALDESFVYVAAQEVGCILQLRKDDLTLCKFLDFDCDLGMIQIFEHHVYFANKSEHCIAHFDPRQNPTTVTVLGGPDMAPGQVISPGTKPGQFYKPSGLAFVHNGWLVVGENSRVQVLALDPSRSTLLPRQIINIPGARDIAAICVSGPFVYAASALDERKILRFELGGPAERTAGEEERRGVACRANWKSPKITGPSRHEQTAAQVQDCAIM